MSNLIKRLLNKAKRMINKPVVPVIVINGAIGINSPMKSGINFHDINKKIEQAFKTKNIKAVAILINSPGGSPVQAEQIFNRLRMLSEEKNIPILAFAEDLAASAGYYILCAGDEIYAAKNSILGSLGVISSGFGFEKVLKKAGIDRRVYSQGKNKSILDPFQKEKKEDIEILLDAQKEVYQNFKNIVLDRRKGKLDSKKDLFTGAFWAAGSAKSLGLIDDIDYIHNVIAKKYGKETELKFMCSEKSWISKRLGLNRSDELGQLFGNVIDYIENRLMFSVKLY